MAELSHRMSVEEFYRWQEFSVLEPLPVERVDIAGALVAATIANVNRGTKGKAASIDDFLVVKNSLKKNRAAQQTSDEAEASHLLAFVLSMGGSVS